MGEMRENILGSEPFKALGSHARVADMLQGILELSARPPSLYVLYVRWGAVVGTQCGSELCLLGDGSGNRMGSGAWALRMSLTQRRAQRYYSLDAAEC